MAEILIHSLALRRDLFLEAGGTPSRYGDFCTWVLAITLHQRGVRLAYSPRPRVHHTYDGDLDHVEPFIRSFRRGDVLYRTDNPPERLNGYLEWVPEWEGRLEYTRSGAWRALRARIGMRHPGRCRASVGTSSSPSWGRVRRSRDAGRAPSRPRDGLVGMTAGPPGGVRRVLAAEQPPRRARGTGRDEAPAGPSGPRPGAAGSHRVVGRTRDGLAQP